MEMIDKELQQRVWQRVQRADSPLEEGGQLLTMIAGAWTDAAAYLQLSGQYRGADAALLRRMHQEEKAHCACLKGMYTLCTGKRAMVKAPPLPKETAEAALRRCYYRKRQSLEAYRQRIGHPEFGPMFEKMHDLELSHCSSILELIGRLTTK